MKKSLTILLILLLINVASAAEIILPKESYQPQELLQAEIQGNFIEPLKSENIFLYRDRSIPIISNVLKQETKHLLYIILPTTEGNYSIQIKNAKYSSETQTSTETIIKEFTIQKTNESALSINPGFVSTIEDFSIKIKNLGPEQEITAEFEATSETQNFTLGQFQEKTIYFSIKDITETTSSNIKINNYNIPVFVYPGKQDEKQEYISRKIKFNPSEIKAKVSSRSNFLFEIFLENLGNEKINNITFSSDENILIEPDSISELSSGEIISINLTIDFEEDLTTEVTLTSENYSVTLPIEINFVEDEKDVSINYIPSSGTETCESIGGSFCNNETETCDGIISFKENKECCKGTCVAETTTSMWIWGVLILILVAAAAIFFFWKMRKKQSKQDSPKREIKHRTEKFENRMAPEYPKEPEVMNRLTNI